jgi:SAM-dependent MidA family methyltransferase
MTFERFMALALYEPELGYYATQLDTPTRSLGDFQTSPQLHPAFGDLIAAELLQIWNALGRPDPLVVAEPGAGDGTLARQILAGLAERCPDLTVNYHAADVRLGRSVSMDSPRATFRAWANLAELVGTEVKAHCVVSNEFFDALPVHRVVWAGGSLGEVFVGWSDRGFVEQIDSASSAAVEAWVAAGRPDPPDEWRGEVCSVLGPVVRSIARLVNRGVVLSIDYGYGDDPADESTPGDSVVGYHRHQWTEEIYRRIGEQDLTSHTDFRALLRLGQRKGLVPAGSLSQRDFLLDRGLATAAEKWANRERTPGKRWQSRFAAAELVNAAGLGKLRVVAQQKGVGSYHLGLTPDRQAITGG